MARRQGRGSPEFEQFLRETDTSRLPPIVLPHVVRGSVSSVPSRTSVAVKLDDSGVTVEAELAGFPASWRSQVGDEVSVYWVDGSWRAVPEVAHIEAADSDASSYFTRNRRSGQLRHLGDFQPH